ncbi:MAG TPA: lipoprotein insertase outer membrane protein LolB [Rudaea sp.]
MKRTHHRLSFGFALAAAMLLAACAPVRVRENAQTAQAQTEREAALAARTHWLVHARIAVSNGKDGGSGDLEWRKSGSDFRFVVHAPVTGKTWQLSGGEGHAQLEGVDPQPTTGSDPERLLRDRVGWDVPLADLDAWVLGARAPGEPAQIQFDAQNLPAVLEQDGWKVEYRDWFADKNPPLPRKVFATRGQARVRVAIESWSFADDTIDDVFP